MWLNIFYNTKATGKTAHTFSFLFCNVLYQIQNMLQQSLHQFCSLLQEFPCSFVQWVANNALTMNWFSNCLLFFPVILFQFILFFIIVPSLKIPLNRRLYKYYNLQKVFGGMYFESRILNSIKHGIWQLCVAYYQLIALMGRLENKLFIR